MSDIAALQAALAEAEAGKETLLVERRAKREKLSKSAFRAYNEETRAQQIEVQQAVDEAQGALTAALNNARQELLVGTISETGTSGGGASG